MQKKALETSRRLFRTGWIVISNVFGGLLAWSVLAPFEGAVITSGAIAVEGNHKAVQHPDGGVVADIFFTEGDYVEAGATILKLDGAELESAINGIDVQLYGLVAREARLTAEQTDAQTMSAVTIVEDITIDSGYSDAMLSQEQYWNARRTTKRTKRSILSQKIVESEQRVQGLLSEISAKRRQSAIIQEELSDLRELLEKGLVAKTRVLALEREDERLRGEWSSRESQIAEIEVQIGEARLEILSLEETFLETVVSELAEVKTQLAELLEQRAALVLKLDRLDITAPESGRVLGVKTHTIGGVIPSTEPLMFIVPQSEQLIALVRILPHDIDKVAQGQAATLRFSSFNQNRVPEAKGTIVRVSADVIMDPATGVSYYEGVVSLPSDTDLPASAELLPGMPVEALLKTESRTVLSYLLRPAQDAMSKTFRD